MKPERWQQIDELFLAALERESSERTAFLDRACVPMMNRCAAKLSLLSPLSSRPKAISSIRRLRPRLRCWQAIKPPFRLVGRSATTKSSACLERAGMGEVYLAQDRKLHRKIALKLLPACFTTDAERLRRFEQEAHSASALNHPNILTIHDIEQVADVHFIAMEYIDGVTLRQHMTSRRMKLDGMLDVAMQIVSALIAAHEAGIVHRDIKPENIMIRGDGYVKVLDFGIAKLLEQPVAEPATGAKTQVKTDTGLVMGTSSYMSPEQARGLAVDTRTDIWSLGVVLYEMAASRVPFEGATTSDVIVSILEHEPLPLAQFIPEAPAELQRIISKNLA